jgi:hypothetical protein
VARAVVELRGEGLEVAGREVTVETAVGRARLDLVTRDPQGRFSFAEVKNGPTAKLTANQRMVHEEIRTGGFIPRGESAARAGFNVGEPYGPYSVRLLEYGKGG